MSETVTPNVRAESLLVSAMSSYGLLFVVLSASAAVVSGARSFFDANTPFYQRWEGKALITFVLVEVAVLCITRLTLAVLTIRRYTKKINDCNLTPILSEGEYFSGVPKSQLKKVVKTNSKSPQ